jgi:hypothetical protein
MEVSSHFHPSPRSQPGSSGDEKSPSLQRINPSSPFLYPTAWPLFWLRYLAPMYRMFLPKFAHYIMWCTELLLQNGTYILTPPKISRALKCQCEKATCNNFKGETQQNDTSLHDWCNLHGCSQCICKRGNKLSSDAQSMRHETYDAHPQNPGTTCYAYLLS